MKSPYKTLIIHTFVSVMISWVLNLVQYLVSLMGSGIVTSLGRSTQMQLNMRCSESFK